MSEVLVRHFVAEIIPVLGRDYVRNDGRLKALSASGEWVLAHAGRNGLKPEDCVPELGRDFVMKRGSRGLSLRPLSSLGESFCAHACRMSKLTRKGVK